ncbi:MAG: hypothetical protein O2971_00495 [Proteobacteria bacterium]|nr:hypothetical protein [Pseudomonadota bacterium]
MLSAIYRRFSVLPIFVATLLVNCGSDEPSDAPALNEGVTVSAVRIGNIDLLLQEPIKEIVRAYLQQIEMDYDVILNNLDELQSQVVIFLDDPTTASINNVRSAWLMAHNAYELSSLHRYFANLVLSEEESLLLFQLQYRMNHWPILPGYIDYVEGFTDSGIVQDITVPLSIPSLQEQHGVFDLAEASLGFHVIEFLLWGENLDKRSPRPVSDYQVVTQLGPVQVEEGLELDQLSNNRRRQLLLLNTQSLVDDFNTMRLRWLAGSDRFSSSLNNLDSGELLAMVIEAMTGMLTQELLVRSLYPLLNGEYVDSIQSPFSHSTQNAVSAQLTSVERLLLDSSSAQGTRLDSILSSLSSDFEELFYQNFDASKECLVLFYSTRENPVDQNTAASTEFVIVECINLLTNMIDHLEQIKVSLFELI